MPNLERRYTPQDGELADAWIFGLIDAIEFIQLGHKHNSSGPWFEMTASQLIEDITKYAEEYWKEEFANVEGRGAVSLPIGSSRSNSPEEESIAGRPTRTGEDLGGSRRSRRARPVQPEGLPRHSCAHPSCKCPDRLDKINNKVCLTEISTDDCGGSGHWYVSEEGSLVGSCTCLLQYSPTDSGGES